MPIYMDRHDVSELVTAENVAQLHNEDLKIQHQFNCRGLTYWFDDIKKIAFCLVDAPDAASIQKMHNHAHGEVPNQIIEVDPKLVESFLGRIKDPVNSSQSELNIINDPAQRTLINIRITIPSLIGLNRKSIKSKMHHVINAFNELLIDYEGRLVKQKEGNLLISFKSSIQAIHYAFSIKKIFTNLSKGSDHSIFDINVGVASGMPVNNHRAFFEDTIKLSHSLSYVSSNDIIVSNEAMNSFLTENSTANTDTDNLRNISFSDENFLTLLLEFIQKVWQNTGIKVDDFSHSLGMSKTLVYRTMTRLTGKSPNSFIREYRLHKALEEMNLTSKTISEIAFESGFNSTSYFSKCFQKRYALLPSEYLKKHL